jgi:hypothetical protein
MSFDRLQSTISIRPEVWLRSGTLFKNSSLAGLRLRPGRPYLKNVNKPENHSGMLIKKNKEMNKHQRKSLYV